MKKSFLLLFSFLCFAFFISCEKNADSLADKEILYKINYDDIKNYISADGSIQYSDVKKVIEETGTRDISEVEGVNLIEGIAGSKRLPEIGPETEPSTELIILCYHASYGTDCYGIRGADSCGDLDINCKNRVANCSCHEISE